ncbi:MAG: hypothetical protein AAB642_04145 [Patescibacteria group bacterium]
MSTLTTKMSERTLAQIKIDELADVFWRLPRSQREALEDVLEEKFVKTVLRRAKEIPRLRKQKKLLSLSDIRQEFLN